MDAETKALIERYATTDEVTYGELYAATRHEAPGVVAQMIAEIHNRVEFRVVVDRESTNPAMSNNGGDYDFGRTIVVREGRPVAVRYWTSADFDYCPHYGYFNCCEERRGCGEPSPLEPADIEGWETARVLEGEEAENARWRWQNRRHDMFKVFA